jgi:hypothetical protein
MRTPRRRQPANSWMQGYGAQPTLEAACQALEARLREGTPRPFDDAPRVLFDTEDGWAL